MGRIKILLLGDISLFLELMLGNMRTSKFGRISIIIFIDM